MYRSLVPHHACTGRHRKIAQEALDSTTLAQRKGAYMLVAWAKQRGHATVKDTRQTILKVGFKGLHWAWMAVAAVQYLRDAPTSCHAAAPNSQNPAQWFAYYVSFIAHFPWDTVALMPGRPDSQARRAMRCHYLHEGREESKAILIITRDGWKTALKREPANLLAEEVKHIMATGASRLRHPAPWPVGAAAAQQQPPQRQQQQPPDPGPPPGGPSEEQRQQQRDAPKQQNRQPPQEQLPPPPPPDPEQQPPQQPHPPPGLPMQQVLQQPTLQQQLQQPLQQMAHQQQQQLQQPQRQPPPPQQPPTTQQVPQQPPQQQDATCAMACGGGDSSSSSSSSGTRAWPHCAPGEWVEGVVTGVPQEMGAGRYKFRRPSGIAAPDLLVYLPGAGGGWPWVVSGKKQLKKVQRRAVSRSKKESKYRPGARLCVATSTSNIAFAD